MAPSGDIYRAAMESMTYEGLLHGGIENWKQMELESIRSCDEIINSTDNMLLRTMASIIKADSQKHYEILDIIHDALRGQIKIELKDIAAVNALIDKHIEIEESAVAYAELASEDSTNFVVHHLMTYLLLDETKHHDLLQRLKEYAEELLPYRQNLEEE